jgi:hypothetical protein
MGSLLAPRSTPKLEDYHLSTFCDSLNNPSHLEAVFPFRYLRTRHAVVTGDPLKMDKFHRG